MIENKIDDVIEKLSTKPAQTEKIMEVINPESKMKGENKIATKKKTSLTDKKTDENIKLIWDAINDIKESFKNLVISVNKSAGNSNEKRQTTEKRKECFQDSQDSTKKQSMDSSSKDKHQKENKPDRHQLRNIIKLLRVTMAALKKTW